MKIFRYALWNRVRSLECNVRILFQKEHVLMADLTKLQASVDAYTDLVAKILAALQSAPPTDQATIDAIAAAIADNNDKVSAALPQT